MMHGEILVVFAINFQLAWHLNQEFVIRIMIYEYGSGLVLDSQTSFFHVVLWKQADQHTLQLP